MKLVETRVHVQAGDGLISRSGSCLLVIAGSKPGPVVDELVAIVKALARQDEPGRTLAYQLAGLMTSRDPNEIPDFCAIGDDPNGLVAVVRGNVELRASGRDEELTLSGLDRPTWVDEYIRFDVTRLTIGAPGAEPAEPAWPTDLKDGVVPGGGVLLTPRPEPGADTRISAIVPLPEAVAEVVSERPFEIVELTEEVAVHPEPLPIAKQPAAADEANGDESSAVEEDVGELIDGINCGRGHFCHPLARYCARCGIGMVQQTHVVVKGARPPLGVLVFTSGMTIAVASDYVVGREPASDSAVASGKALPLVLSDEEDVLSRVHAEIQLRGWDVYVIDRESANGTYVRAGDAPWRRLSAGTPEQLAPRMEVRLGEHEFTFDSHHLAGG